MKAFDEHFDSARRHFGVALIDLNYAAADLARSVVCPEMEMGASAAFDLLNREIERLKDLSALIDQVAQFVPPKPATSPCCSAGGPTSSVPKCIRRRIDCRIDLRAGPGFVCGGPVWPAVP
jgi:hypothetical protein